MNIRKERELSSFFCVHDKIEENSCLVVVLGVIRPDWIFF